MYVKSDYFSARPKFPECTQSSAILLKNMATVVARRTIPTCCRLFFVPVSRLIVKPSSLGM